jgi:hypothetical protein
MVWRWNDYSVCLTYRGAWFAGKPRSNGFGDHPQELGLGRIRTMSDDAVCQANRGALIAGKHRSHSFGVIRWSEAWSGPHPDEGR